MEPLIRPVALADMAAIEEIQRVNPTSAQWNPVDYLAYDTRVAVVDGAVAGFIAVQNIPPDEVDILNLAVHRGSQRRGVATALLHAIEARIQHLDVRESNSGAIAFYSRHGFRKCGHRRGYYSRPTEDSIMMSRRLPAPPKPVVTGL
jgi:ribosomal-protein-alanine N-acetyltransferase